MVELQHRRDTSTLETFAPPALPQRTGIVEDPAWRLSIFLITCHRVALPAPAVRGHERMRERVGGSYAPEHFPLSEA